jgi:hypothetical protein
MRILKNANKRSSERNGSKEIRFDVAESETMKTVKQ